MAEYYVYELVDPRNNKVFYVGKGLRGRVDQHEREARKGKQSKKCDLIREIEASGRSIIKRKVSAFQSEVYAFRAEAELIERYRLENLTNVHPGGGSPRSAPTVEQDRELVGATAELINRSRNGTIRHLLVAGKPFDLLPILEGWKDQVAKVIDARGIGWANRIAKRYGVRFVHG